MIFPFVQVARVDLSSAMVNRFRNAARGAQAESSPGTMWVEPGRYGDL